MAGFSLGGGGGGNQDQQGIPPESFFLYNTTTTRGEEYTRGFELWQQQQQHQHQQQQRNLFYSGGVGVGLGSDEGAGGAVGSGGSSSSRTVMMTRQGGSMSCQDCGNQAKKDCSHMRCRTCCKSRGFQCPTHIKSTWVPASRRRERQHQLAAAAAAQHEQQQQHLNPKRHRETAAAAAAAAGPLACTRLPSSSGMEVAGNFPAELTSEAVFRCVRVSGIDDPDEQYAYQTAVSISGHVFKGILYDHGPDSSHYSAGEASTSPAVISGRMGSNPPPITAGPSGGSSAGASAAAAAALLDPSSLYPTPLNAFMAGTQFFPHPRS
ncbi:protein SHI RELATED SEQUENCE 1 isoform X2 [Cinnamomum micranthum f. kanehirae]|uniref:Protein SHI RELATED SEQUENCE 1 isoform X2 n=1 Tax=Cinnamomum micranthum f. kanehirae TaxID=337451 RepID=A0A3S3N1R6_9MAGN|nr:protein SHI RELATED SEQUENCE 1 isoform X2 [Cinnamomum micranthum f. kanehirae]